MLSPLPEVTQLEKEPSQALTPGVWPRGAALWPVQRGGLEGVCSLVSSPCDGGPRRCPESDLPPNSLGWSVSRTVLKVKVAPYEKKRKKLACAFEGTRTLVVHAPLSPLWGQQAAMLGLPSPQHVLREEIPGAKGRVAGTCPLPTQGERTFGDVASAPPLLCPLLLHRCHPTLLPGSGDGGCRGGGAAGPERCGRSRNHRKELRLLRKLSWAPEQVLHETGF